MPVALGILPPATLAHPCASRSACDPHDSRDGGGSLRQEQAVEGRGKVGQRRRPTRTWEGRSRVWNSGREQLPRCREQPAASLTHPCMIKFHELWLRWSCRIIGSPGKPSHPKDRQKCLSLYVDWLPALFAHARCVSEASSLHTQGDGRRLCRVGEPVIIIPQLHSRK